MKVIYLDGLQLCLVQNQKVKLYDGSTAPSVQFRVARITRVGQHDQRTRRQIFRPNHDRISVNPKSDWAKENVFKVDENIFFEASEIQKRIKQFPKHAKEIFENIYISNL